MMGHGSAVLAGLVFVANELNNKALFKDATHYMRARSTIVGFMAAFAVSCFGLMHGIGAALFGAIWALVVGIALVVYVHGVVANTGHKKQSNIGVTSGRIATGASLYVLQIVGAVLLAVGVEWGIYVAAVALTLTMIYLVSGAWLLFIGAGLLKKKGEI